MLSPNTLLQNGRYRILRPIGQGGMGTVYEAHDNRLNNRVAVKQAQMSNPTLRQAFEREAQRLARLFHPALPNVIDHFVEGKGQFLVMRFIDGLDLAQQLNRRPGPFPFDQVLPWADRLLDALTYLHSQQPPLIHRDIKPANLKLTEQGDIILLDFGMAKGGLTQATASGTLPGYTLGYASYEQIVGQPTDARSDLYALGATLYTLMTDEVPPNAIIRTHELFQRQPDPLLPAHKVNPLIPAYVADVLARAMALAPSQRPSTAAAMATMLKAPRPISGEVFKSKVLFASPIAAQNAPATKANGAQKRSYAPQAQPIDPSASERRLRTPHRERAISGVANGAQNPSYARRPQLIDKLRTPDRGARISRTAKPNAPTRVNQHLQPFREHASRSDLGTRLLPEAGHAPALEEHEYEYEHEDQETSSSRWWPIAAMLLTLLLLVLACGIGMGLFLRNDAMQAMVGAAPPLDPATATVMANTPTPEPIQNNNTLPLVAGTPAEAPLQEGTVVPSPTFKATVTLFPTAETKVTLFPTAETNVIASPTQEANVAPVIASPTQAATVAPVIASPTQEATVAPVIASPTQEATVIAIPTQEAPVPTEGASVPTEAASAPAEGENPPSEGASLPTEGENPPAEGASAPAEGENPPSEEASAPAEGASPPSEGENPPAEGASAPAEGENPPAEGENPPTEEASAPAEAASPPAEGENPPAEAASPPAEGENPPAEGENTPTEGENPPTEGASPPAEEASAPSEEASAPAEGASPPTEETNVSPAPAILTREGNGPDLHAPRRTSEINLDGFITEWENAKPISIPHVVFQPENWSGPEDLSGVARAVWDEEYLYLAVKVTDDAVVQESANEHLHRGDAVELFWDIDLASDFGQDTYSADEAQMVFSPGNFSGKPPFAWVHQSPTGNFRRKMMVGYSFSPEGYQIEMRVPWSGLAIVPESGQIYGYALALSDDDTFGDATQETQMATTPKLPYLHPTHWGNFILD